MALKKLCSYGSCRAIVDANKIYCEKHQALYEAQQKERYKEYSKRRRRDKDQKRYQDFYNSEDWKRIRLAIIISFYHIDILEFYRTGRVVQGERVHHIIELEEDWNSRLDIGNLIYVTEKNHRRIHVEYCKGKKEKKQMQDILFALLEKWFNEFL